MSKAMKRLALALVVGVVSMTSLEAGWLQAQEAAPVAEAAAAVTEAAAEAAPAEEGYKDYAAFKESAGYPIFTTHNLWMMIAAALVFIMHLGFASVESGLTQSKNTVNILFKNTLIPCIGILTYALIGFNLMYPGYAEGDGGIFKYIGLGIYVTDAEAAVKLTDAYATGPMTFWTDFLFQAMFAATAATIVSGAVAERVKLSSFLVFSTIFVAIAYPIAGSWKWGYGWLWWAEGDGYIIKGT